MKAFFFMLVSTVLLLNLTACGRGNYATSEKISLPSGLEFTMDYPTNADTVLQFTDNDDYDTLAMAGPYYGGALPTNQPGLNAFNKARQERVQAAIDLTMIMADRSRELKKELEAYKRNYVDFLNALASADTNLESVAQEAATLLVEYQLREEALTAYLESVEMPKDNPPATAFLEYSKTVSAVELANVLTEDLAALLSASAQLSLAYEDSVNADVQKAVSQFDDDMLPLPELLGQLTEVQDAILELDAILKQINTADYYIGLAALEYIRQEMPGVKEALASNQAGDRVSAEDIEFMSEYAAFLEGLTNDLQRELDAVDPADLISPKVLDTVAVNYSFLMPTASAAGEGYFSRAMSSLKSGVISAVGYGAKKVDAGLEWTGVKTLYRKGAKDAGFLAEGLRAGVESGMDLVRGKLTGQSEKEIARNINENFMRMHRNIQADRAGADLFKTAEGYLDALEKAGENAGAKPVEQLIGKGYTSWLAGKVGQMTVNFFTGFGKGVYKVANQESTKGTVAEGMLDIGFSFMGGSKALLKGSQVAKGSKESFKLLGQKGFNFLEQALNSYRQNGIKNNVKAIWQQAKLTGADYSKLLQLSLRDRARDGIEKSLEAASKEINIKFADLMKTGGKAILTNATTDAKKAIVDFVSESFVHGLKGYNKALQAVIGKSAEEYFDNLVGNAADDVIKAIVKEAMDGPDIDVESAEECDEDEEDCDEEPDETNDESEAESDVNNLISGEFFSGTYVNEEKTASVDVHPDGRTMVTGYASPGDHVHNEFHPAFKFKFSSDGKTARIVVSHQYINNGYIIDAVIPNEERGSVSYEWHPADSMLTYDFAGYIGDYTLSKNKLTLVGGANHYGQLPETCNLGAAQITCKNGWVFSLSQ